MQFAHLVFASLCAVGALAGHASAWNYTGHRVIATLAYDELTPEVRTRVDAILRAHPRYEPDLLGDMPQGYDAARYAFAMSGYWPDIVRSQQNPMHFTSHHPQWHYINVRYELPGAPPSTRPSTTAPTTAPATAAPTTPSASQSSSGDPQNVVEALAKCREDLKNPALTDTQKAVALCWLVHLVGDIHQPLHAATLYSPQFPEGDRGGNSFIVLRNRQHTNLHALWDEAIGMQSSPFMINYIAAGIRADSQFQKSALPEAADGDSSAWIKESHELARSKVYLNGALVGASNDELRRDPAIAVPGLPEGYLRDAEVVSLRRAALAGHRLSDVLNSLLGK